MMARLPRKPADPGLRIDAGVATAMIVIWIGLVAIAVILS